MTNSHSKVDEVGQSNDHPGLIDIAESKSHPKFWFDDGSLVIQAASIRYRVHRTIICSQSTVFKDTMSLPQPREPLDAINTFEGCPLIQLPADNPDDLSSLLEAIYDPDYFRQLELTISSGNEDAALKIISGILQLSTKYEFGVLRRKAVQILELLNPTEPDGFMTRYSTPVVPVAESDIIKRMERLFEIIALSTRCRLPQFLPSALYSLSCLLASDGSQDHLLIQSSQIGEGLKLWCLSGGNRMAKLKISSEPPHRSIDTKCTKPPIHHAGRMIFRKLEWPPYVLSYDSYCHKCTLEAEKAYYAKQQEAWDLLPDYFGFGGKSWADLKQSEGTPIE